MVQRKYRVGKLDAVDEGNNRKTADGRAGRTGLLR